MIVKFPGKLIQVARASVSPPSASLEEVDGLDYTPVLTWPDFPELSTPGPHGPLHLQGLNRKAELILWKWEVPADEVRSRIRRGCQTPPTAYLTARNGLFGMYDPMTGEMRILEDFEASTVHVHREVCQERVLVSWFVDPRRQRDSEPVKTCPFPRPYELDTCWLSPNSEPLFDMRAFARFLDNHSGTIGDPYAWREVPKDLVNNWDTSGNLRRLQLGEEDE